MKTFGLLIAALLTLLATAALVAWWFGWEIGGGEFGDDRGPQLVWAATIGALLAAGIVGSLRQRWSQTLLSLLAWAGAFLILMVGYSYRAELTEVWQRVRGEVFTSEAMITSTGEIQVRRSIDAHFYVDATVNSAKINFMIDTGASSIALSWADARAVGIDPSSLRFTQRVMTANGMTLVAPVRLERLAIGPIERRKISAVVLPEKVQGSLLGLGFLDTLSSYEFNGDKLTMRD